MFAMAHSTWHIQYISSSLTIISFTALIWISLGTIGTVSAQIEAQPWYESLPAVAMDYKIHLDAGKEDCYYQYVQPGATLYVSFQVSLFWSIRFHTISPDVVMHKHLESSRIEFSSWIFSIQQVIRGGDGMAGFAVRHPNGQVVKPYQWQPSAEYTEQASTGGYYAVCLDNQFSRFAGKLVNIYITVIKYEEWAKYAKEIEGLQLNIQNFTVSSIAHIEQFQSFHSLHILQAVIGQVERNINAMAQFQSHSRSIEARDYALLIDNNAYVQNWSLTQIVVILLTCSIQVM